MKICQRCLIDVPSTAHTLLRCRSFGCFVKLFCSLLIQYIKVDLGIRTGKWKSSDLVLFGYRFTHVIFWFDYWMVFQPFLKSSRRWPAGCCFLVHLFMIVCAVIPIYIYIFVFIIMLGCWGATILRTVHYTLTLPRVDLVSHAGVLPQLNSKCTCT